MWLLIMKYQCKHECRNVLQEGRVGLTSTVKMEEHASKPHTRAYVSQDLSEHSAKMPLEASNHFYLHMLFRMLNKLCIFELY